MSADASRETLCLIRVGIFVNVGEDLSMNGLKCLRYGSARAVLTWLSTDCNGPRTG